LNREIDPPAVHRDGTPPDHIVHDRGEGRSALIELLDPDAREDLPKFAVELAALEQTAQRQTGIPKLVASQGEEFFRQCIAIESTGPEPTRERPGRYADDPPRREPPGLECLQEARMREEPEEARA